MFAVINSFTIELQIFHREHANGMYSVLAYYLTKSFVEIPLHIFVPLINVTIIYWMVDLKNSLTSFIFTCLIMILNANASIAFGHLISVISPNVSVANTAAGSVIGIAMLFSGVFINNASIPKYILWIKYFSWMGYTTHTMFINQWQNVTEISCEKFSRCFSTGDDVINSLNLDPVSCNNSYGKIKYYSELKLQL